MDKPPIFHSPSSQPRSTTAPLPRRPSRALDYPEGFTLVHYADSPTGLLAQGHEGALRRHVLDAPDFSSAAARVRAVQETAHSQMGAMTIGGASLPVNIACLGWPLLICMPRCMTVSPIYPLLKSQRSFLSREITHALARAMAVEFLEVAHLGLFQMPMLLGLSPLLIHQLLTAFKSALRSGVNHSFQNCQLPLLTPPMASIGPLTPVAMVLTCLVAWPLDGSARSTGSELRPACQRLESLIQGLYTHQLLTDTQSAGGHQDHQVGLVQPQVRVGSPALLFDALAQAQWMQAGWMSELARRSQLGFSLRNSLLGDYRWIRLEVSDEDGPGSEVSYAYESFWQPPDQLDLIDQRVSLSQAIECMPDVQGLDLH